MSPHCEAHRAGILRRATVRAALHRLHYFEEGTCIVHHLFGAEVSEHVRAAYGDAYLTAHFEVRKRCSSIGWK
jgi:quinolinate synthase